MLNRKLIQYSLFKNVLIVVMVRVLGAGSIFLLNYIVAKELDVTTAGYFFWAMSCFFIATQLSLMGMSDVALKYISQKSGTSEWGEAVFILKKIFKWVVLALLFVSVVLFVVALCTPVIYFEMNTDLKYMMLWMVPGIVFWGVSNILAYVLQATGHQLKSIFVLSIGPYFLFCVSYIILSPLSLISTGALFTASYAVNFIIACVWFANQYVNEKPIEFPSQQLWQMALPLWAVSMMSITLAWGGAFLSGRWVAPEQIAFYSVAVRAAALINFFMIAVNFVLAPKIARLYSLGNMKALQREVKLSVRVLYCFSFPTIVIILIYSKAIMGLFGETYEQGYKVLLILVVGQVVNIVTGPVGYLLTMTGNERYMRNMYLITGIACLGLIFILTPLFGVEGTAWATCIAMAVHNIGCAAIVFKKMNISVSPFGS
ncbi:lipopolysaccharide biosynthesis protein [Pseudomonas segetis]